MEDTSERSRQLADDQERKRRLNHLDTLRRFKKSEYKKLFQSVELFKEFKTPEQVETARGLILDGYALDAEEAHRIMEKEALTPKTVHYTDR